MSNGKEKEAKKGSFWTTVPGILTGCAALVTAVGGIISILVTAGVFSGQNSPTAKPLPSDTPPPINTPLPPDTPMPDETILSNDTSVSDNSEGQIPDFKTLVVRYDDTSVRITIAIVGIDNLAGEPIYMYGTNRDEIKLDSSGAFRLLRDNDDDGHFEELIFSGTPGISGSSISIEIPAEYLPDIAEKRIWGYSLQSKDRIPDEGELSFSLPSEQ